MALTQTNDWDLVNAESPDKSNIVYNGSREIQGLQILKILCALLVVQIHEPSFLKGYLMPLTRIAVPIFFMITGYFLLDFYGYITVSKLKRTLYKVSKLYLIVAVVYILYRMIVLIRHPELYASTFLNYRYWVHLFVTGKTPVGHLWYLVALIQGIIIILIAVELKCERWLILLIPIGLALNLIIGSYHFVFDKFPIPNHILLSRNVFTIGLPCLLIGVLIRRYEYLMPSFRKTLFVTVLFVIAIYLETILFRDSFRSLKGDIIIFTVPCAVCTFLVFLKYESDHPIAKTLAKIGKNYSLDIYVWHILVAGFVMYLLNRLGLTGVGAFVVAAVTLMLAIFLKRINLKRFYS